MVTSKISTSQPRTRRGSGTLHFLAQEELKRLWAVIQDARDTVLFLLAYRRDLRASQIGLLQRTDVDLQQGRITVHRLKHSMATHLLDDEADVAFVKHWLGHKNIQNTTIYAQPTPGRHDAAARQLFVDHRVVESHPA